MLNPFHEINWRPDTAARRVFAKSLFIGFPCLAFTYALFTKGRHDVWDPIFALKLAVFGAGAGALFYAVPGIALPFYLVWFGAACAIGFVVGNVLMAVMFFVVVTGTGLLKRALARPALRKSFDRHATTYWQSAPPARSPASYFKQF
jgi:hypothetical protein